MAQPSLRVGRASCHYWLNIIIVNIIQFTNKIFIYTIFLAIPVTGKFYAAHDQLKAESEEETRKVDNYHHNVTQSRAMGPHSKYPNPATENQVLVL